MKLLRGSRVAQEFLLWNELEGEDRSELVAPVVSLPGHCRPELQVLWCDHAVGPVVVGGERDNVAGFVHEGTPLIQSIGERRGVEVRAAKVVAVGCFRVVGAVGAPHQVQYPSGILAFRVGAENTRERKAHFRKSAGSADGLEFSGEERRTVAI